MKKHIKNKIKYISQLEMSCFKFNAARSSGEDKAEINMDNVAKIVNENVAIVTILDL